jgi:hypothetical protein
MSDEVLCPACVTARRSGGRVAAERVESAGVFARLRGFLKAFGNWPAKFKAEPQPPAPKLLYRRGGLSHTLSHSLSHRLSHDLPIGPIIPPAHEGRRRRFAELYAIERSIQGRTADARRHVRNTSARPFIEMIKPWLEMKLGRVPPAGPSPRPFVMRSRAGQPSPDLLPHRHRKAPQRRALCLAQRRPAAHDRRSSRQPPRRVLALELAAFKRQGIGHVQGMDPYGHSCRR